MLAGGTAARSASSSKKLLAFLLCFQGPVLYMHTVDFFSGHESAKAAERHEPWSSDYLRQAVVDLSDPTHREQEERQEGSKEQEGVTSCSVARDNRLELLPTLAEAL
jgi:hypothetical protein